MREMEESCNDIIDELNALNQAIEEFCSERLVVMIQARKKVIQKK
jgi:hypothetical protein